MKIAVGCFVKDNTKLNFLIENYGNFRTINNSVDRKFIF